MNHIAQDLGVDSIDFKLANVVKQGDGTSTSGIYHFPVPLVDMLNEVKTVCMNLLGAFLEKFGI